MNIIILFMVGCAMSAPSPPITVKLEHKPPSPPTGSLLTQKTSLEEELSGQHQKMQTDDLQDEADITLPVNSNIEEGGVGQVDVMPVLQRFFNKLKHHPEVVEKLIEDEENRLMDRYEAMNDLNREINKEDDLNLPRAPDRENPDHIIYETEKTVVKKAGRSFNVGSIADYDPISSPVVSKPTSDLPSIPAISDETNRLPSIPAISDETNRLPSIPAISDETNRLPSIPAISDETNRLPSIPAISDETNRLPSIQAISDEAYHPTPKEIEIIAKLQDQYSQAHPFINSLPLFDQFPNSHKPNDKTAEPAELQTALIHNEHMRNSPLKSSGEPAKTKIPLQYSYDIKEIKHVPIEEELVSEFPPSELANKKELRDEAHDVLQKVEEAALKTKQFQEALRHQDLHELSEEAQEAQQQQQELEEKEEEEEEQQQSDEQSIDPYSNWYYYYNYGEGSKPEMSEESDSTESSESDESQFERKTSDSSKSRDRTEESSMDSESMPVSEENSVDSESMPISEEGYDKNSQEDDLKALSQKVVAPVKIHHM